MTERTLRGILDDMVGEGGQFEDYCDKREHDAESVCLFCELRAKLQEEDEARPTYLEETPKKCAKCGSDNVDMLCAAWVPLSRNIDVLAVSTLEDLREAEIYTTTVFCNNCQAENPDLEEV